MTQFGWKKSALFFAAGLWLAAARAYAQQEGTAEVLPAPREIVIGRWVAEFSHPKRITWQAVPGAKNYRIEVFSWETRELVFQKVTSENFYLFSRGEGLNGEKEGYYLLRVAALTSEGILGEFSPCGWTYVGNKKRLGPAPTESPSAACASRLPAQVLSGKFYGPSGRNASYNRSAFQVEGASFLMKSIAQKESQQDFALAMLTTVRGYYWFAKNHGLEGSFKAKVVGYNDLGNNINPQALEARYHLRWEFPFFWKALVSRFQLSTFVGYENYKNQVQNGAEFAGPYDLYKVGSSLKFRLFQNWDTGGELVYGDSGDGSQKIEMQGYLNYYFRDRWSLGVGYRMHLFQTTSAEVSPIDAPEFKEAFGEGFGNLRYSF